MLQQINENLNIAGMVTINEAATIVGLAKFRIRQLCLEKRIKHVRAGRKYLVNLPMLVEYLNSCTGTDEATIVSSNNFNIQPVEV